MKRQISAALVVIAFAFVPVCGCGEPKAPPPGAPQGKVEEINVDLGNPPTDTAPKDSPGPPTTPPTEKDSSADESGEK